MAANGCVEEKSCAGELDISGKSRLDVLSVVHKNGVFDHAFTFDQNSSVCIDDREEAIAKCLGRWNGFKNKVNGGVQIESTIAGLLQSSPAPLTLCTETDREEPIFHCDRRTLRIDRAGSTDSVAATSGGESCRSSSSTASDTTSEPSSPSRPVTPQPMPPVPAHLTDHCPYECLRADSEDSGLGTSPAKSLVSPSSPEGYVSPLQFTPDAKSGDGRSDDEDDRSDSLLDLCPCENSNDASSEENTAKFHQFRVPPPHDVSAKDEEGKGAREGEENEASDQTVGDFHFRLTPSSSEITANESTADSQFNISATTDTKIDGHDNVSSSADVTEFQFLVSSTNLKRDSSCGERIDDPEDQFCVSTSNCADVENRNGETVPECPSHISPSTSPRTDDRCTSNSEISEFQFRLPPTIRNCSVSLKKDAIDFQFQLPPPNSNADCAENVTDFDFRHPLSIPKVVIGSGEEEAFRFRHSISNPKVVLVRTELPESEPRAELDYEESRQSPYSETNQERAGDSSSADLCHDLTSDCTSSSCSQTISDGQSGPVDDGTCKWLNCDQSAEVATSSDLIDHIRQCHVQPQGDDSGSYVCLWVGCKVYDRPSSSRSWLERHVLLHGGNKPFRCIVDGCHQRFSTEGALQRHVNSHFPQSRGARTNDHSSGRLCRRKRLKNSRRRCLSVKTNDFFDDGIMEHVRHSLFELSSITGMDTDGPPGTITFHSTVIARRVEGSGKAKVLLHWDPENMLPDCWVSEAEVPFNFQKIIPVSNLPPEKIVRLDPVYASQLLPRPGKRRRK